MFKPQYHQKKKKEKKCPETSICQQQSWDLNFAPLLLHATVWGFFLA
jgi:hypothetical protein